MARQGRRTAPTIPEPGLLHGDACLAVRRSLPAFLSQTQIQPQVSEGGGLQPLKIQSTQEELARRLAAPGCGMPGEWLMVCKPRQAMTSTLCVAWLLRELEYSPGFNGAIICDKDGTNAELHARLRIMYENQHPMIKVPSSQLSEKGAQFAHGGRLKVITAKGRNPAIGFSIDRLLCSEFGYWTHAKKVVDLLFPTLLNRPQARVIIESTPGAHGSTYHSMWTDALAGKGRFKPVFIEWWKHAAYTTPPPPGYAIDARLLDLVYPHVKQGMTLGHCYWMEQALNTIFGGDIERFQSAYPFTPYDGWLASGVRALPSEPLRQLLLSRQCCNEDPPSMGGGWSPPVPGRRYLICVDPNSYGDSGDPTAMTIFDLDTREEVSAWEGRIDPAALGRRLAAIGKHWNDAQIVVESNAAACITALCATGYIHVYGAGNGSHPGFYRTTLTKEQSEASLAMLLTDLDNPMRIRSKRGLLQLLGYDGSMKRVSLDGSTHHWDRVVTYSMAAYILRKTLPRPAIAEPRPPGGGVRLSDFASKPSAPRI